MFICDAFVHAVLAALTQLATPVRLCPHRDCETWMYPNMVMLHRDIASGLVDYRYARIPGAEFKAKTYTPPYNGTMFPWESAFTGREVCPHGYGTCLREIHISGDIVCVGAPVMVSHGAHAFVVVTPPSVPAVQLRTASVLAHDEEQDVVAARSTANCDWVRGISSPLVVLPRLWLTLSHAITTTSGCAAWQTFGSPVRRSTAPGRATSTT